MKKSPLFLNSLLLLISTGIAIFTIELFCHLYLKIPINMPAIVYFDPTQKPAKRIKPNLDVQVDGPYREFSYRITTSADGFRQTYSFSNLQHLYLAILGDSQSFGVGMNDDQTFASYLAKYLGKPVLNAACPGYNTIEEFWIYKNEIQKLKPEHVLLFFFAGNDPYENFSNRALYDGKPLSTKKQKSDFDFSLSSIKKFLAKHSAIYHSLIQLRQTPTINQFLYNLKLLNPTPPSELAIFRKDRNGNAPAHWQITEKIIADLRREVESSGSQFKVVFVPERFQVDKIYWQQWITKYQLNPENFDLRLPNQHLEKFCKQNAIPFTDVTETLTDMQDHGKPVYWKIDNHLNAFGHQTIANFLISQGLTTENSGVTQ